ncbi:hypothetical protein SAY87_018500 [Trapa incisa]|uniref:Vacuolar protein-sorting-associated protein 36 n=1 Tax=Trapa incisa TaxID=236973 RepID=A0AAN7L8K7_9MYRT|nr:hypothetical protein SAY87_018500 [Trapa incisa]
MAGGHLPLAELTGSGRPVLLPSEIECSFLPNVELESEESANFSVRLKSGLLILTTHRLIWLLPNPVPPGSKGFYFPLAAISQIFSSKKSMFASLRLSFQVSVGPNGRVDTESLVRGSRSIPMTVVMRGKGDVDSCDQVLGELEASILRREQEIWESTDKSLHDAFQDLNALMSKAKEMVMLAEKIRLKLLSGSLQAGTANVEEMGSKEEMQDWLLSVGIISPVTKESAGALYHQQLSCQLADFVKFPLERSGGMINLIDIYCLFNRARGTELISPEDLLQACSLWDKLDVPSMLRKFDSRVMVIQNKSYRDEEVFARINTLVTKPDTLRMGISASDAALTLGIAPAMAKEHLLAAESLLCRDLSPDGFRFYVNLFPGIISDELYLVQHHGIYALWNTTVSST